ncbi:hypothetical protein BEWA_027120 [Theileria equi strain WA]|uniref:Uncharacterized protein n=1 Tax=Theileria equi strain WA TaxID=1537102 RepID=L0AX90_THEEQ|nr:hypothetical protein BEWA_027120 [Theileria equi strain WA]AFZ79863.1 hypothetical protein BEWA_027120 [Theileria equi strain WA]|eukprot:XP_004829529.1 hypothetical protein BEWA_027120 [Theileria equi strain WA]
MARNSEKANAMLNKWLRIKSGLELQEKNVSRRPRHTSEVEDLKEAQHWRNLIVKDIMLSISRIQNASLGEHAIRDLNDEINRLIGLRKRWDERIIELGGPDYRPLSASIENAHGAELKVGGSGYKYFGAARNLPGVRELFEKEEQTVDTRDHLQFQTRAELYRMINPDYYGFRDEDDGQLLKAEQEKELEIHARESAKYPNFQEEEFERLKWFAQAESTSCENL